jgi:BCD family chlorophyll transporter-like MFS transporter
VLAVVAFSLVGLGVGAAGTSLLVLLAGLTEPARRPAAATLVWLMMFAGFVITAITVSVVLTPFSLAGLVKVTIGVAAVAMVITALAVWNMERNAVEAAPRQSGTGFGAALRQVWAEPASRRFSLFVFFAMLAYSAQELILDPFAGQVFGLAPAQSTQLSGLMHGGALVGMLAVAAASLLGGRRLAAMRSWTVGGCIASALAASMLAVGGLIGPGFPLQAAVVVLGIANGSFAVSAIGAMMQLVSQGDRTREGVRMGIWGAAQAIAFGLGGLGATGLSDIAHTLLPTAAEAYAVVFVSQSALFLAAAYLAVLVFRQGRQASPSLSHHSAQLAPSGGV